MHGRARNAALAITATLIGGAMASPAHAMRTYVDYDSLVIVAGPGEANLVTVQPHPNDSSSYVITDPGATITAGSGCTGTPLGKVAVCTIESEYGYSPPSLTLSLRDKSDVARVEGGFYILQVDGGIGDDRLTLPGAWSDGGYTQVELGPGNDDVQMGGGWSDSVQVHGGDGNDTIDASDSSGGYYYGDGGNDAITTDGWVSGGDGADTLDGSVGFGWGTYFGDAGNDSINTDDLSPDTVDCGAGSDTLDHDELDEFFACEA